MNAVRGSYVILSGAKNLRSSPAFDTKQPTPRYLLAISPLLAEYNPFGLTN